MERSGGTYRVEHWMAWFFAIAAILLGVVGALEAWNQLNIGRSLVDAATGAGAREGTDADYFRDGALFLLPSLIAGILAWTLHRNEHHVTRHARGSSDYATLGNTHNALRHEDELVTGEHAGAYIALLASIAFGIAGVLVGFDVFNSGYTFYDGLTWLVLSLMSSIVAATLHSVGHHQPAMEEDYVRRIVDARVSSGMTTSDATASRTEPSVGR